MIETHTATKTGPVREQSFEKQTKTAIKSQTTAL